MGTESQDHGHGSLGQTSQGQKPAPGSMPPNKDSDQKSRNDRSPGKAPSPRTAPPQEHSSHDKRSEGGGQHDKDRSDDSNRASQNRGGDTRSR